MTDNEWYWPSKDRPGKAIIRHGSNPDTWGIEWQGFPALEQRGGWSGPYNTPEEAEASARVWIDSYGLEESAVVIERSDA